MKNDITNIYNESLRRRYEAISSSPKFNLETWQKTILVLDLYLLIKSQTDNKVFEPDKITLRNYKLHDVSIWPVYFKEFFSKLKTLPNHLSVLETVEGYEHNLGTFRKYFKIPIEERITNNFLPYRMPANEYKIASTTGNAKIENLWPWAYNDVYEVIGVEDNIPRVILVAAKAMGTLKEKNEEGKNNFEELIHLARDQNVPVMSKSLTLLTKKGFENYKIIL